MVPHYENFIKIHRIIKRDPSRVYRNERKHGVNDW